MWVEKSKKESIKLMDRLFSSSSAKFVATFTVVNLCCAALLKVAYLFCRVVPAMCW